MPKVKAESRFKTASDLRNYGESKGQLWSQHGDSDFQKGKVGPARRQRSKGLGAIPELRAKAAAAFYRLPARQEGSSGVL